MKGSLTLVVVAAIATWAFLFFPLEKEPKGPRPGKHVEVAHDATPRPSEPVQRATTGRASDAEPAASTSTTAASPAARQASASSASSASGRGDVKIIGSSAPSTASSAPSQEPPAPFNPDKARATGELGEGALSPDFKMAEESYVQEPRDGPWASQHEVKIRTALYDSELREDVVFVHCQSTVCRIHLNPRGADPFAELMRVPGLAAAAGIDSSTPYSLNGSELIVYARPENAEPAPK